MGNDTSPENMPTSSNTDPMNEEVLCHICGRDGVCGGTGMIRYDLPVGHKDFGKLFRCPNYQVVTEGRREILRKLGNLEALNDRTFHNFYVDMPILTDSQRQSLETALQITYRFAQNPQGWLLLIGTYGCGKTHLAAAAANLRLEYDDAVLFVTTPDLLDHLRTTFGPTSEVGYDEVFDRMRNAPMLVLDDLGVENPSQWAKEKLFQLLNHRYVNRLPTIITTNADIDTLDPRIRSRLLDEQIIRRLVISAPDYRTGHEPQRDQLSTLDLYHEMTFQTFDVDNAATQEDRQNLGRARDIAMAYAQRPSNWLMFLGHYGCGKTHLAASIGNYALERGISVVFVTVPDLFDQLRQTFDGSGNFDRRFNSVKNAQLLILDDIGAQSNSAWAREKLFQILNHRYVTRQATVMTTAKSPDELDERLRSRFMDRSRCMAFAITAPAYSSRPYRK